VIILSHPTANQNVRQAALAFATAGLLQEFWTCVHWQQGGLLDQLLAITPRVRNELRRRSFCDEIEPFIRTHALREMGRQLAAQLGLNSFTCEGNGVFSIDAVYLSLDRRVSRRIANSRTARAVYAYDGGALASFRAARARGIRCMYEHPIVHWRTVRQYQLEEAELSPEWVPTLGALCDSEQKLRRKDEELALADVIVTPSSFARESLTASKAKLAPVYVIPYGTTTDNVGPARRSIEGKLRVLFVGALTQAKGLGYLLQAADQLTREISLTLIGRRVSLIVPPAAALERHRWIASLSHADLLREMRQHDVLVLPSLHEGFGLVLAEAMGQGLVVIATRHTAAPDLVTDGIDGFLVPIRSASGLEEKLLLLHRDRTRLRAMQGAAQEKARSLTWENYRQRLVKLAREVIGNPVSA
jgi:alpha-maltose-1-phosphate synthase